MTLPGYGEVLATCSGGVESALASELATLGIRVLNAGNGVVRFAGGAAEIVRANLELRTASRVLLPVLRGRVRTSDELYRLVRTLPWRSLIPPDRTFAVTAVSRDRALPDIRFLALTVKDAIADSQRAHGGKRSAIDRRNPDVPVSVFVAEGEAEVSLDTSGAPLHERGYRIEAGEAPLRETLAAAMLLLAGYRGTAPLADPFCGSGTIAIEAALIASGAAPGRKRSRYAFRRWEFIPERVYREATARLKTSTDRRDRGSEGDGQPRAAPAPTILSSDIDPDVIRVAERNAERAGVRSLIRFDVADAFDELPPPDSPAGLVVTNPPYGERMALDEAGEFYGRIGSMLKHRYAGWEAWVLAGNPTASRQIGLRTKARITLYNGGIESRLLRIPVY